MIGDDLTAMLDALDNARAIDFVRYVAKRMRDDQDIKRLSFETGWNVMVGAYASMAAQQLDVRPEPTS